MIRVLVIYHSQGGKTRKMAEAVAQGAAAVEDAEVSLKSAAQAGLEDLLVCDGLAVGSPEYFGYMAGMIKDFFDRTYPGAEGRPEVFKKPYVVFVGAGNDGSGAVREIERIALGYPLRKVQEPLVVRGDLSDGDLEACRTLGQTIAAGLDAGIY
jgi:multimeric flavodoxin WrbA